MKLLSIGQHFHHYGAMGANFRHPRASNTYVNSHVHLSSNSSENLWLSRLPASFMKSRSKLKELSIGQGQIWAFSALKGKYLLSEKPDLAEI